MYPIKCKLCEQVCTHPTGLYRHLKHTHFIDLETYFTEITKTYEKSNCQICEGTVSFNSSKGYAKYCPSCSKTNKSEITRRYRLEQKNDPIRSAKFSALVSSNMRTEWLENDQTARIENMTKSIRANVAKLTDSEKKERYGWMNKLSKDEKELFIKTVMLESGAHAWWRNASEDEKLAVYEKRADSLRLTWDKHGIEIMKKQFDTFMKNKHEFLSNLNDYQLDEETMKSMTLSIFKALGIEDGKIF